MLIGKKGKIREIAVGIRLMFKVYERSSKSGQSEIAHFGNSCFTALRIKLRKVCAP